MTTPGRQDEMREVVSPSLYASKPWLKHYDYWVPETFNCAEQSVYQILGLASSLYGNKIATSFLGVELTYSEIKRLADRFAVALDQLGIHKGDRVGIML